MVEGVDAGAQAAVQAEDLAVNQSSQGQVVEQVLKRFEIMTMASNKAKLNRDAFIN